MAISKDVTQLALILQGAGFVAIAGEILTEIDRGRTTRYPCPHGAPAPYGPRRGLAVGRLPVAG